jgi:hypothetical protein
LETVKVAEPGVLNLKALVPLRAYDEHGVIGETFA